MTQSDRSPRRARERIGADKARVWARELDLRNPYAKSILLAIANYMNEDGSAFPGTPTISRDTDISEETVTKRLKWLEQIGAIAIFKCWVDENGRRNHDGRGRPTSSEVRFLFDADCEAIEESARNSIEAKPLRGAAAAAHDARISPRPDGELNQESDSEVSSPLAPYQPPPGRDPHIEDSNLEGEDSPQSPPLPSGEAHGSASAPSGDSPLDDRSLAAWLAKFRATYPEPSNRPGVVASLASGLTEIERALAQRGAEGVRAQRDRAVREKRRPKPIVDAAKFLGDPALWAEYARFAPPPPPPEIFVAFGSLEWRARAVRAAICGARMPGPADIIGHGRGAIFHREADPRTFALADYANESGSVDTRDWPIIEKTIHGADGKAHMTPEFAAWGECIKEWTGYWPSAERIALCDAPTKCTPCWCEQPFTYNGKTTMTRGYKYGLRVPTPFPPAKGGRASATGPPSDNLTQEDSDIVANF